LVAFGFRGANGETGPVSWFRFFLFEDDMETLRVSLLFHAREKIRGKMVMRIETKDTQERLGRKFKREGTND